MMKYYYEKFGFEVNSRGLPIVHCVCSNMFSVSYEETMKSPLFNCPKCNELWHFEYVKDKQQHVLIRPRTNGQGWI
jgi:transcription initiation factor IIE alpha subunit